MDTMPEIAGFAGLCVFLCGIQFWTLKQSFALLRDHLGRIEFKLDRLPCRQLKGCNDEQHQTPQTDRVD